MRGQRTIFQSAGDVQPANSIRMQCERTRAAQRLDSFTFFQIIFGFWREFFWVIGIVQPAPLLLLFIPPDQFFALAPRLAIRTCRRPVIDDAAIVWPGESPTVAEQVMRFAFIGAIPVFFRKDAAINPRPACRASVVFQILNLLQLFAIVDRPAVDLFQYL